MKRDGNAVPFHFQHINMFVGVDLRSLTKGRLWTILQEKQECFEACCFEAFGNGSCVD